MPKTYSLLMCELTRSIWPVGCMGTIHPSGCPAGSCVLLFGRFAGAPETFVQPLGDFGQL